MRRLVEGRRRAARVTLVVLLLAAAAVVAAPPTAAQSSGSSGGSAGKNLTVVNYNILHGIFCPSDTDSCRAPDRVALFLSQLQAAKCPQVVGLQEVSGQLAGLIGQQLPGVCAGKYKLAMSVTEGNDKELVFSTLPAKHAKVLPLPGGLRNATRVELQSDLGPVVLVVTHQDGDKEFPACRNDIDRYKCPKSCPEGTTFAECHTVLGEAFGDEVGSKKAIRLYMGDFNIPAGNPRYQRLIGRGWVDSHLAAGNAECVTATGVNCTAGRNDVTLTALQDPTTRESERIDFIFVKAPKPCTPSYDSGTDADRDGTGTGLFAAQPAVNGPSGLAWPSDHTAVSMDLSCA
jgi:endonuclease/exonuclease/phosphatase family metal-dependent hydrolase